MKWYIELKGNEKLHGRLILISMFIIIVLLLYVIFMVKETEFFINTEDLYKIMIDNLHCPVCHPKGV